MAQRGTVIGLLAWVALGCSSSSEPTVGDEPIPAGISGFYGAGAGGTGGIGGAGGVGGAGGFGAWGDTAFGGGVGGAFGLPMCTSAPAAIGACVDPGGPLTLSLTMNGVVEAIEAPGSTSCSQAIGSVEGAGDEHRYDLVIREGEATVRIALRLPWNKPVVSVGDAVRVAFTRQPPGFGIRTGKVILRDSKGGLLLAVMQSDGFREITLPELTFIDGRHTCSSTELGPCGSSTHGDIRVVFDSDERTIGYGMHAESSGDYVVALGDNTRFTPQGFTCTDVSGFQRVVVAVVRGTEASLNGELIDNDAGL